MSVHLFVQLQTTGKDFAIKNYHKFKVLWIHVTDTVDIFSFLIHSPPLELKGDIFKLQEHKLKYLQMYSAF